MHPLQPLGHLLYPLFLLIWAMFEEFSWGRLIQTSVEGAQGKRPGASDVQVLLDEVLPLQESCWVTCFGSRRVWDKFQSQLQDTLLQQPYSLSSRVAADMP
eukprot:4599370-Amphidinium_carterae.2